MQKSKLPIFQSDSQEMTLMQTKWAQQIEGVLRDSNSPVVLESVSLLTGDNVINHRLGRKLSGWRLIRIRAAATVYDKQDTNQMPALTLVLNTSAPVIVDIEVF